MQRGPHRRELGSVMVIAMVLIAIVGLVLGAYLTPTNWGVRLGHLLWKQADLEEAAASGIELAKSDLNTCAKIPSFENCPDPQTSLATGLIFNPVTQGAPSVPRIAAKAKCETCVNVYYFPSETNPDEDDKFPKYFRVVSHAMNNKTGQSFTVEAFLAVRIENFAEISFGMMAPTTAGPFNFGAATYFGRVHFGNFPVHFKTTGYQTVGGKIVPVEHVFKDRVTFAAAPDSSNIFPTTGTDKPFTWEKKGGDSVTQIKMENGFESGVTPDFTPENILGDARSHPSPLPVAWQNRDLCLKADNHYDMFTGKYQPRIYRYDCDFRPDARWWEMYKNEALTPDEITGPVTAVDSADYIVVPTDGLNIVVEGHDVAFKGVVTGKVTVVALKDAATGEGGNIILGGDVQHNDQRTTSKDRVGLIAEKDVIVPYQATPDENVWWKTDYDWTYPGTATTPPVSMGPQKYNGIINFPTSRDRNEGDSEYKAYASTPGGANAPSVLDLDASIIAMGKFDVQGLNDFEHSSNGVVIPAFEYTDPNDPTQVGALTYYSTVPTDPNYYYDATKPYGRKGRPLFCQGREHYATQAEAKACPPRPDTDPFPEPFPEMPRQAMSDIQIYGGLITKEFSGTSARVNTVSGDGAGFRRRVTRQDTALSLEPPPFFPQTSIPKIHVEWAKKYPGCSKLLETLLGPC